MYIQLELLGNHREVWWVPYYETPKVGQWLSVHGELREITQICTSLPKESIPKGARISEQL